MATKFKIEQLALRLPSREGEHRIALRFLERCGIRDWVYDVVEATGTVHSVAGRNKAALKFNYDVFVGNELELLQYDRGDNWLQRLGSEALVSHIGMHCTEEELVEWRALMADFCITLAQEVWTDSHSNPRISDCRRYHYVIYSTRHLIGVDMKFIVRRIIDQTIEDAKAAEDAAARRK